MDPRSVAAQGIHPNQMAQFTPTPGWVRAVNCDGGRASGLGPEHGTFVVMWQSIHQHLSDLIVGKVWVCGGANGF